MVINTYTHTHIYMKVAYFIIKKWKPDLQSSFNWVVKEVAVVIAFYTGVCVQVSFTSVK